MIFRSRRDQSTTFIYGMLVVLGFFLMGYAVYSLIVQSKDLFFAIFNGVIGILVIILVILVFSNTYYELRSKLLYIRNGPFVNEIRYNQIEKIEQVNNFIFSAALAKDRLKLYCGTKENGRPIIAYISPENQDEFLRRLLKNAPKIKVIYNQ